MKNTHLMKTADVTKRQRVHEVHHTKNIVAPKLIDQHIMCHQKDHPVNINQHIVNFGIQFTSTTSRSRTNMWPIGDSETISNSITAHDVVSYSMDGAFLVVIIIVVVIWKWRRNASRLKALEAATKRINLEV